MTRSAYRLILQMHPPGFRRSFGDQMLAIFDESPIRQHSGLVRDVLASFGRQWLFRTDSWIVPVALAGGFIQVFGFHMPSKGHQSVAENLQPLTTLTEQMVLFALALVCSLFILIMSMTLWNGRFQRTRNERSWQRRR